MSPEYGMGLDTYSVVKRKVGGVWTSATKKWNRMCHKRLEKLIEDTTLKWGPTVC